MERIAIIGWGSLLWDLDDLEPHVTGDWYVDQGPTLPIEFALVSHKRNRALAAVIDHSVGEHVTASVIESSKDSLPEALVDLARRERCDEQHIGAVHRANGFTRAKLRQTLALVEEWLHTTHYDGAVWTDIETNFEVHTGEPFTVSTAVDYLKNLSGESLREAKRYIENAPVSTPLRRRLQDEDWWAVVEF
jgi:hypothetical protein